MHLGSLHFHHFCKWCKEWLTITPTAWSSVQNLQTKKQREKQTKATRSALMNEWPYRVLDPASITLSCELIPDWLQVPTSNGFLSLYMWYLLQSFSNVANECCILLSFVSMNMPCRDGRKSLQWVNDRAHTCLMIL